MTDWTVVIPVKGNAFSKSRLGASAQLALALALDTAAAAAEVARVVVITSAASRPLFEALGAQTALDEGGGLLAAVVLGLRSAGTGPTAVLLGDVPALRPSELEAALALATGHPLAFVPDADDDGTVLITALDPTDHRPAFGVHSRAAHLASGYVELEIPSDSGLRRDVDTAEQLDGLGERVGPRTRQTLSK
ncbi:MAG TPA: NTP transferase domain-containing protein [Galbitalea sp.]